MGMTTLRTSQLAWLTLACLAMIIGIGLAVRAATGQVTSLLAAESAEAVALNAGTLERILITASRDLRYLARSRALGDCLEDMASDRRDCLLRDWSAFVTAKPQYDQIRWIDETGLERVRVNRSPDGPVVVPQAELQNKADRYYFTETMALPPEAVYVSPLDLNIEQGVIEQPHKPMLRLAQRVFDRDGNSRGILIVNYLALDLLAALADLQAFDTWMLNQDGYWLRGPSADDEWGFMLGRPERTLAQRHPDAWARIVTETRGQLETAEGLWSFDTLVPAQVLAQDQGARIPPAPSQNAPHAPDLQQSAEHWKLVNFVPRQVYRAEIGAIWLRYGAILVALLAIILGSGWVIARSQRRELQAHAVAATRVSEERLELAVVGADIGIWDWDLISDTPVWSDLCRQHLALPAGQTASIKHFHRVLHPDDRARVEALIRHCAETGEDYNTEYRVLQPDGTEHWIGSLGRVYCADDGTPLRMSGTTQDITARKQAEQALSAINRELEQRVEARTAELQQALEHMARSEARFRTMVEQSPLGIALIDSLTGQILELNDRFAAIAGRTREEMNRIDWMRITHPDDLQADLDNMARLNAGEIPGYQMDKRYLRPDGSVVWASLTVAPLTVGPGEGPRHLALIEDITESKHLEEALRESETRYRLAIEATQAALWDVDLVTGEQVVNDHWYQQLGYAIGEVEPSYARWRSHLHPDDLPRIDQAIERFIQGLSSGFVLDYRILTKTGALRWLHDTGEVVSRDAKGRALRMIGTTTDITESVEGQQRIQEALSLLQLATDAADIGIWSWDVSSGKVDWDARLCAWYAVAEEDRARGLFDEAWRNRLHPEDRDPAEAKLATALRDQTPYADTFRLRLPDGQIRVMQSAALLETAADGSPTRMIGINRDITADRAREEALRAAKAQAEAADVAKSAFVANMSHEVRTPMNAVLGFLDILLDTDLDTEQRSLVQKVKGAGQALLRILNDILDFSKLDAGKVALESALFRLDAVLQQVAELFAIVAHEKGLELVIDAPPALAGGYRGDDLRLSQILNNLVGNAIKFSDRGSVEIVVRVAAAPVTPPERPEQADLRWLRFEVRDRGIGLTPEQAAGLFEPFAQADASITRRFGGSGLGLTISKRLVELMGGVIGVDSAEGEGSTFWLELPLTVDATVAEARRGDLMPGRVLVVDDQASVREVLERYLSTWGFRVDTAADAVSGVTRLLAAAEGAEPVSLLILDWKMPCHDGLWLLEQLQGAVAEGRLRRIPIVLMVSAFERQALRKAAARGPLQPDLVLSKPVSQSMLLEAIADLQQHGYVRRPAAEVGTLDPDARARRIRGAELLLVEDNLTNQEVALAVLGKLGLRVSVANNGREALDTLAAKRVDLVLMDLQMPVMDGFETTAAIRAADWGRDIPIIAMTAAAFPEDRERVLAAGMNDHVSKPIDRQQLVSALLRWLPARVEAQPAEPEPEPVMTSATESAAVADETSAVALHLDGFDLPRTRQRLGDDETLLRVILGSFLREFQDWSAALAAARAAADTKTAVRLVHTIKGAAANVGAVQVQATAEALEAALQDEVEPARVDALLADCLVALEVARAALRAYLPEASPAAVDTACDLAAARADLAELERLLSRHRLVRDTLLERLRSHLGDQAPAELGQLCEQIRAFDYERARATLARMQEQLP
ncbi:MAG: PAS domain S-box protein [Gammaproteobacteria bacterium]|nr:PAS domain S-box protein [Gammaproteobacteria bacterium]